MSKFAIVVKETKSVYREGDERSRTHPGHGYSAHTETIQSSQFLEFDSEEAVKNWVLANDGKKNFRVFAIEELKISVKMVVKVETEKTVNSSSGC